MRLHSCDGGGCATLARMESQASKWATYEIEALVNNHCQCGENPLWDERRNVIFWEDIPNGRIYSLDPKTGKHQTVYDGEVVGGFSFQDDGKLLLFRDHEIAILNDDGSVEVLTRDIEAETGRFNDVMADPEGRVFAGTMGQDGTSSGGLFRVDLDGSVTKLWDGTSCANGMGFTPDLQKMYWTDSEAQKIFLYDYNRETGELSNRTEFYSSLDGSTPDGMSVDAAGDVWSAHWDGFAIHRLSPQGELKESIRFPVAQVSSLIFGGENLDEIYVTTAGGTFRKGEANHEISDEANDETSAEQSTPDGTLYRVRAGVKGQPRFRSRIQI